MSKLIKRKDGSYSKRGLWDNIRKNKGSGKEPTKEMLKQESKIKKEENMKSMYKKGGKAPKKKMMKDSFMEESKEITFDAPGVKPPMKKMMGGETGMDVIARMNQAEGEANMAGKKKMLEGGKKSGDGNYKIRKPFRDVAPEVEKIDNGAEYIMYKRRTLKGALEGADTVKELKEDFNDRDREKKMGGKKMMGGKYAKGGFPDLNKDGEVTKADILKGRGVYKKGGAKSMKPGGGGRFAAMVGKLKSKGKSEESAEAIAASAGRKKYGKSKFQAMAAAGKKKMMGGKKC